MIKIHKATTAPAILTNEGKHETDLLNNAFQGNPNGYQSSTGASMKSIAKFTFKPNIYRDKTVKKQLIKDQHDKCCFCEGKFSDNSFGDVEHFRPKAAYKAIGEKKLTYPGYYWLAYDWNNLLYSCEKCNRAFKKNVFPLGNEATRKPFHNHTNSLEGEDRLLIDPTIEDPSDFFTFNEEVPVPINGNLKGSTSIKAYGLERLNDSRLEYLKELKLALVFTNIDETDTSEVANAAKALSVSTPDLVELVRHAKNLYHSVARNTAKFAYCVRCKFPYLPTTM